MVIFLSLTPLFFLISPIYFFRIILINIISHMRVIGTITIFTIQILLYNLVTIFPNPIYKYIIPLTTSCCKFRGHNLKKCFCQIICILYMKGQHYSDFFLPRTQRFSKISIGENKELIFLGHWRVCLVHVFKHILSVFKQYYTYFHILFHIHIFSKNTNNVTKSTLPNRP